MTVDTTSESLGDNESIRWWREKPVWIMLFLGFSAGIPILLIFSSLSLWLLEAGVERSTVTYFSWAVLGYSFKFVWAPLVDRVPIPVLTNLFGRRRAWMLLSQFAIIGAILLMAFTDPKNGLWAMAIAAVLLGFSSATQDIVIDAYRIESAVPRLQAMLSSTYIAGYRVGMILAGAGALHWAEDFGSTAESYSFLAWHQTYLVMASFMLVGVITTLLISEPKSVVDQREYETADYASFFAVFLGSICCFILALVWLPSAPDLFDGGWQNVIAFLWGATEMLLALLAAYMFARLCLRVNLVNRDLVQTGYVGPIEDFLSRYGKLALWVLLLVGFYRISDIVLGVISNVFYADMGYTKKDIANVSKVFGVVMTITGAFIGGIIALRIGVMRTLFWAAILVVITNLLFLWLTSVGSNFTYFTLSYPALIGGGELQLPQELILVIVFDNLVQGISLAAFIAWLSSLTNVSFTATQYALFSSVMTLFPKFLGGYSGTLVEMFGYHNFFIFASLLGIPIVFLVHFLAGKLEFKNT
ncbi:MAG: MFS transporter [Pseudomonadota bacterium]